MADEALRYRVTQNPEEFANSGFGSDSTANLGDSADDAEKSPEAGDNNESPAQPDPSNGACPNGSTVVSMEVTGYTSGPESTGKGPGDPGYGRTASGATACSPTMSR